MSGTTSNGLSNIDDILDEVGIGLDGENGSLAELNRASKKSSQASKGVLQSRITLTDAELAVRLNVIPTVFKDMRFDIDAIKENVICDVKRQGGGARVRGFNRYCSVCTKVLDTIRQGKLPNQSYLIGAPVGFGKTNFVVESLVLMVKHGWLTVPYVSLTELAAIKIAEEQRLMKPFTSSPMTYKTDGYGDFNYTDAVLTAAFDKKPAIIVGKYSWSEYMNARILFVYLSSVLSKELESNMLAQLLNIRGSKGLPTIVMIGTSLEPYLNDVRLKELVWSEITEYEDGKSLNRLYHVSCYKRRESWGSYASSGDAKDNKQSGEIIED